MNNAQSSVNRGAGLPKGLSNLGDTIRVFDRDGADLGQMIVWQAQKLASDQGARLFVTEPTATPPVVRIVVIRNLAELWAEEARGV